LESKQNAKTVKAKLNAKVGKYKQFKRQIESSSDPILTLDMISNRINRSLQLSAGSNYNYIYECVNFHLIPEISSIVREYLNECYVCEGHVITCNTDVAMCTCLGFQDNGYHDYDDDSLSSRYLGTFSNEMGQLGVMEREIVKAMKQSFDKWEVARNAVVYGHSVDQYKVARIIQSYCIDPGDCIPRVVRRAHNGVTPIEDPWSESVSERVDIGFSYGITPPIHKACLRSSGFCGVVFTLEYESGRNRARVESNMGCIDYISTLGFVGQAIHISLCTH
jgi:hypothetical protein